MAAVLVGSAEVDKLYGASWFVSFLKAQASAGFPPRGNVAEHVAVEAEVFNGLARWKRLTAQTTSCATSMINPDMFKAWLTANPAACADSGGATKDVELAVAHCRLTFIDVVETVGRGMLVVKGVTAEST